MYCLIFIPGGLLIMMGQHARSEALFYYFTLEEYIPQNHLLRLIDKHVDFSFVRERLKDSYSDTGRPSVDPELLLRMLLIGYLYGITNRAQTGRRVGHASGLALVHGAGFSSADSASFHLLQEPPRTVSRVEAVRAAF